MKPKVETRNYFFIYFDYLYDVLGMFTSPKLSVWSRTCISTNVGHQPHFLKFKRLCPFVFDLKKKKKKIDPLVSDF